MIHYRKILELNDEGISVDYLTLTILS